MNKKTIPEIIDNLRKKLRFTIEEYPHVKTQIDEAEKAIMQKIENVCKSDWHNEYGFKCPIVERIRKELLGDKV